MGTENDQNKINIYFKITATEDEVKSVENKIKKLDQSSKVIFINKEKALDDFKKTFGDYSQNLIELNEINDIVPFILEVTFSTQNLKSEVLPIIKDETIIEEITELNHIYKKYYQVVLFIQSFLWMFFALSFFVCLLMTALLVKNVVHQESQMLQLMALFGQSYKKIIIQYMNNFLKYFLITVVFAVSIAYSIYMMIIYRIGMYKELYFVAERIVFLSINQIIYLTLGFALAYFTGLYVILSKSLQKAFHKT